MRMKILLAVLFLFPFCYVGAVDGLRYRTADTDAFTFSTIGELWIDHAPAGFSRFKAGYQDNPDAWDRNIRPYLEWTGIGVSFVPAALYIIIFLVCWLLGVGPFRNWASEKGVIDRTHNPYGRTGPRPASPLIDRPRR